MGQTTKGAVEFPQRPLSCSIHLSYLPASPGRPAKLTDEFKKRTDTLETALGHSSSSAEKHAKHVRDAVVPAMLALRETSDALESTIPHGMWPLATYREMLFIK